MRNTKQIDIKNRKCYFFDDMINIKIFDSKQTINHTKILILITSDI